VWVETRRVEVYAKTRQHVSSPCILRHSIAKSLSKGTTQMEMGTPVLDDPKETISPPDSQPATPLTASTALTIPSPIPLVGNKPSDKESDVPRCPTTHEAASIPLPPSPPLPKASIPFRRPRISNPLSRVVSDRQPGSRSVSGRRVSSALQYAMQPEPEKDVTERVMSDTTSASIDLKNQLESLNLGNEI
jgi:hypothetical protein